MNNTIMRTVDVTADYAALASEKTVASVALYCPSTNAGTVYVEGDTGQDVPWAPGEWHGFENVNLAEIRVKGTPGDAVLVVGGTWSAPAPMGRAAANSEQPHQIGRPQADLTTSGAGWVDVAIPDGAALVDFFLDVAAYVVADDAEADPAASGVPYQPNLNLRLPCTGCTHLHLKRVGGSDVTCKWNTVTQG